MQNFCGQARFPSGRWRNICLITHPMPKWRNGRRRGFKIPRLHGRVSSNLTLGTNYPLKLILWPQWLVAFVTKFYKEFHSIFVLITSCSVLVLSDTVHRFEFSRIGLLRHSNADRRSILIRRDGQFWPWLFPNDEQSTLSSEIIHKCFKF